MYILGINAYHGNASAALVSDGRLVAAVEEERFNRVKYAAGFPVNAIRYCLDEGGIKIDEVDHIAIPRNPWARLGTKIRYAIRMPKFAMERAKVMARFASIQEELAAALEVESQGIQAQFHRVEHHLSHLASSFFVSPFDRAAVLSADGLGDFASTMWATGSGPRLQAHGSIPFPHSLGMYYTAITQYLGFWKYGDEYKIMGLSAYGEPSYLNEFRRIVQTNKNNKNRGLAFKLGLDYFIHHQNGSEMTWRESNKTPMLGQLFSPYIEERLGAARAKDQAIEKRHQDIAATLQARLEEVLLKLLNALYEQTRQRCLCLAGGVAFNCVANGKIFDQTPFEELYVQPAAGDAGLAVGAAYYVYHQILGFPRNFVMNHAYWGPSFSNATIRSALEQYRLVYQEIPDELLCHEVAKFIANGDVVGWFQGRMEWGPRALGSRSIIVDPRRPEMKDILNQRIKHREPFRPFAPSILEEAVGEYFEKSHPSPFMVLAYKVRPEKRALIPAPIHVDGTSRLQTVSRQTNPRYWRLINEFKILTGVPVVLNTSFNENEPIVCTPQEAIECFLRTKMDTLAIGNYLVRK